MLNILIMCDIINKRDLRAIGFQLISRTRPLEAEIQYFHAPNPLKKRNIHQNTQQRRVTTTINSRTPFTFTTRCPFGDEFWSKLFKNAIRFVRQSYRWSEFISHRVDQKKKIVLRSAATFHFIKNIFFSFGKIKFVWLVGWIVFVVISKANIWEMLLRKRAAVCRFSDRFSVSLTRSLLDHSLQLRFLS